MGNFRRFLEGVTSQKENELRAIWADAFKALGIGGLSDEDAGQQSLSRITFSQRGVRTPGASVFKGKQAARKRLENGQIFARLQKMADPELTKAAEEARRWLDQSENGMSANASTTVGNLLEKLFGSYYPKFIDSDVPRMDTAKAQVPPQRPKDSQMDPNPPQPTMNPQQQPQVPVPPQPTNPGQPRPQGNELGLY